MSISSASELELVLIDQAPPQLERGGGGIKKQKMARGVEVGDYSREAIYRGTAIIRGLFCFGVMVEYDNPVTSELPRGLCHGEQRSSWLANWWWCCYDLKE